MVSTINLYNPHLVIATLEDKWCWDIIEDQQKQRRVEHQSGEFKHTVENMKEVLDLIENSEQTSKKKGRAIYMLQEVRTPPSMTVVLISNLSQSAKMKRKYTKPKEYKIVEEPPQAQMRKKPTNQDKADGL